MEARQRVADRLLAELGVQALDLRDPRRELPVRARELVLDAALLGDVLLDRDEVRDRAVLVEDGGDRLLLLVLGAVLAPVHDRPGPRVAARHRLPEMGVERGVVAAGLQDARVPPDELVGGVARDRARRGVDPRDRARAVRDDDAVRGGAQRRGLDAKGVGAVRAAALVADRARDETAARRVIGLSEMSTGISRPSAWRAKSWRPRPIGRAVGWAA